MNPANFPNVGAAAVPGVVNPGQITAQNNQVQRYILQRLQSRGPYDGWRAEVSPEERTQKTWQMFVQQYHILLEKFDPNADRSRISSLRLIHPKVHVENAVNAALTFEEKAFQEAHKKEDYEKECNNKLHAIKETRMRQQTAQQNAYENQGIMQNVGAMPGGPNPQFNPQMTRPMQASPIPTQMPVHMGMNDLSTMQSQPRQQQTLQQQNQMGQQRLMMTGMPFNDELALLSQAEFDQVAQYAATFIDKIPPDDLERRRAEADRNFTPEAKEAIIQKHGDTFTYMIRMQIVRRLRASKRHPQATRTQAMDPNNPMMGSDALMNQRQMGSNMMGLQRNAALPMNPQPGLNPSAFMGNVENIQGQQADGLRSQEAGQLVVPASNAMSQQPFVNPNAMFQPGGTPQHAQNGQLAANRPAVSPQQFLTAQQLQNAQQDLLQQNPQFPTQNQPQNSSSAQVQAQAQAQARAQAAHNAKMAMANQNAGQLNQGISNQSPAMPMVNRAGGPNMSPAQAAAQGRPPSQSAGQPQTGRTLPASLPPVLQDRLAQMPPEARNQFLLQRRRALANNQAKQNAQPMPVQANATQQQPNGQLNEAAMRNMQQQLGGMAGAPQNNPMLQGQTLTIQQQQQRQQILRQQQFLRQQNMPMEAMSPEQVARMDRVLFPRQILNSSASTNPPVPNSVKTWGQLKEWVVQTPQVLGQVDLPKLSHLQRLHLMQTLSHPRAAEQTGQPNWPGPQPQFMPNQNVPGAHPQVSMLGLQTVSATDIQLARQKLGPQSHNVDDEQIKSLIMRNRQRHVQNMQQNRNLSTPTLAQNQGMPQPPAQTPAAKQPTPLIPPAVPASLPTSMSPPAPTANIPTQAPASTAGRNTKAGSGAKPNARKRPAPDDVIEVQNPKTQAAPQAGQPPIATTAGTARPPLPFTKEQIASMPPHQRAQIEAQMKRLPRPQATKVVAEENWNKALSDELKKMYNDMIRHVAKTEPPKVSVEERALISQQLRDSVDMLSRLDSLVQFLIKAQKQSVIPHLFLWRIQIMRQFKSDEWSLNDELNISPEALKTAIGNVRDLFKAMIKTVQAQHQQKLKFPNAQMPSSQSNVAPLNASNLEQHQQQEEAKRARRTQHQNVPAAPTSAQPPFPLGAPSPQGVPQAYGPGDFSPDKMKIPVSKRRKQSHTVTPTHTAPPKAEAAKQAVFKCSVPECEYYHKGFATQVELERHVEESHKAKEEISDPLQYALDSFASALGSPVDEKGSAEAKDEKAAAAIVDAVSLAGSKPISLHTAKRDVKAEGISTKPVSPTSQQLLTPRSNVSKTAKAPLTSKTASIKAEKDAAKTSDQPVPEAKVSTSGWANSKVSLLSIQEAFGPSLKEESLGFGGDLFNEFVNTDMFMGQAEDTPDSVDSIGLNTQTPKDGEMIRDDSTIKINDGEDEGPLPLDWFSRPGPMFSGSVYEDPWVDWDLLQKDSVLSSLDDNLAFSIA